MIQFNGGSSGALPVAQAQPQISTALTRQPTRHQPQQPAFEPWQLYSINATREALEIVNEERERSSYAPPPVTVVEPHPEPRARKINIVAAQMDTKQQLSFRQATTDVDSIDGEYPPTRYTGTNQENELLQENALNNFRIPKVSTVLPPRSSHKYNQNDKTAFTSAPDKQPLNQRQFNTRIQNPSKVSLPSMHFQTRQDLSKLNRESYRIPKVSTVLSPSFEHSNVRKFSSPIY